MLLSSAGTAGPILLLVFAVGVPVQLAVAALIGLGRRIGGVSASLLPALLLGVGMVGTLGALDGVVGDVGGTADPSWIPWFALQDRARALAPLVLGGTASLLLVLPPLFALALRVVQDRRVGWGVAAFGVVGGVVSGVGAAVTALWQGTPGAAVAPAVVLPLLTALAAVGASETSVVGARTTPLHGPRIASAAWVCGALALLYTHVGFARFSGVYALPDFEAVFSSIGALDAQEQAAAGAPWVVGPWVLTSGLCLLPAFFLRRVRALPTSAGVDAVAVLGLSLALLIASGWAVIQWELLSHVAGDAAAYILQEKGKLDVPHLVPVPSRVLLLEPGRARWIVLRDHGGAEANDAVGALEDAARSLRRDDGIEVPPDMTMEDLYFTLADVQAGSLSVVGCGDVGRAVWSALDHDPLRAVGRCGAFPLGLRVTEELRDPRTFIVLKDRQVDDDGDVREISEITGVDGRDVLLRGQADATFADFVAALGQLKGARRVFMAWGVSLEGDDIPVGVNPGIRVHTRVGTTSPNGQAPEPAGATVAAPQ